MSRLDDITVASVNGESLTLLAVVNGLKIAGKTEFIQHAVEQELIRQLAREHGLSVSDAELQEAADAFRQSVGLHRAADTQSWLANNQLSLEDLETKLEGDLLTQKLRGRVIAPDNVSTYFAEHKPSFDWARLSQIMVTEEALATELLNQLGKEQVDFGRLARKYSVDTSREEGGYLGVVSRDELSSEAQSAVFDASEGDLVGPLRTDAVYNIIGVWEIGSGALTDKTQATIRDILFTQWLNEQAQVANIHTLLDD